MIAWLCIQLHLIAHRIAVLCLLSSFCDSSASWHIEISAMRSQARVGFCFLPAAFRFGRSALKSAFSVVGSFSSDVGGVGTHSFPLLVEC